MKQTAVEWLKDQLESFGNKHELTISWTTVDDLVEQAKEMEKQQIIDAWNGGDYAYFYSKETNRDFVDGNEYYNETYGKESKPLVKTLCHHKGTYTTIIDSNGNEVCGKCRKPIAEEDKQ